MRTISIFKNGNNQAVRLPKDMEFEGISELSIIKEGDTIFLKPVRKSWSSFSQVTKVDDTFLDDRPDLIEKGRF